MAEPQYSPRFSLEGEGLASSGRVGRDAAIASTVVIAGMEVAKSQGWVTPETLASMPTVPVLATGALTFLIRVAVKFFGRYKLLRG